MISIQAVGRLTKETDLRTTTNGTSVINFTLACKRKRPDKDGKSTTTFITSVLWGKPAQVFAKYTQKGILLALNGELQTRSYDDQQGVTHYVTELLVDSFEFLESKETITHREQRHGKNYDHGDTVDKTQNDSYEQQSISGISEYGYNE